MLVKDLVRALKKCNQKSELIFYHLKNNDLINQKLKRKGK